MNIGKFFSDHHEEYLKFHRIPEESRYSNRPDLHAFMLLDNLLPGIADIVSASEKDEIFLAVNPRNLMQVVNEQHLIDLIRCGVMYNDAYECFFMFT